MLNRVGGHLLTVGPRRITQDEIRGSFPSPWHIETINAAVYETNLAPGRAQAWLATITKS